MNRFTTAALLLPALTLAAGLSLAALADEPKPAEPGTLIVIDPAGKEQKLKSWKFTTGIRELGWLPAAPNKEEKEPAKDKKDDDKGPKKGPAATLALVVREENSTSWKEGVVTLVPMSRIKSVAYDNDKQTVAVHVATDAKGEAEVVLTGTTEYESTNRLVIEAEVDKGDLGVAEVVYKGGSAKGIRGIRFPPAKADEAPAGARPALVTFADKRGKNSFKAQEVLALYRSGSGEKTLPTLMFKKTIKMDLGKVVRISSDDIGSLEDPVWQVALKDGTDENFTLLRKPTIDGQALDLEGILARVPAGYRLVPVHALAGIDFEKVDGDDKPKDKDEKAKDKEEKKDK
jgi:hypothetical protein